jgi:deferrochelatase/peroxidase EfeB
VTDGPVVGSGGAGRDALHPRVSRRAMLGGLGVIGAGAAVGGAALLVRDDPASSAPAGVVKAGGPAGGTAVPFHGVHQAGIATPAQDRLLFGAFDLTTTHPGQLVLLLQTWTRAAERLAVGRPVGDEKGDPDAPPDDTGEALGLGPARLTLTFGFGPTLFVRDGDDRFGLATKRPAALADLPRFPGDRLDPAISGGDLAVQVTADDPQVAYHALRNLTRLAKGVATLRWVQTGFGRTASTSTAQSTPRNLQGFKDGTNNLKGEDEAQMAAHVWVGERDDPAWMRGGSYLVTRRIRMFIETWDRSALADQEHTIGRVKESGAPLGGREEFETVDLRATRGGKSVIPADAHIRLASHETTGAARILRRGYSFTDGVDAVTGQLDGGLFFIAYQRDPRTGFIPIQRQLAASDALNEYIEHTSSALFAIPPGVAADGWIGETLFA